MLVKIDKQEWYPVYQLSDDLGYVKEVHGDTVERWKRISEEFHQMQREMAEIYRKRSKDK